MSDSQLREILRYTAMTGNCMERKQS